MAAVPPRARLHLGQYHQQFRADVAGGGDLQRQPRRRLPAGGRRHGRRRLSGADPMRRRRLRRRLGPAQGHHRRGHAGLEHRSGPEAEAHRLRPPQRRPGPLVHPLRGDARRRADVDPHHRILDRPLGRHRFAGLHPRHEHHRGRLLVRGQRLPPGAPVLRPERHGHEPLQPVVPDQSVLHPVGMAVHHQDLSVASAGHPAGHRRLQDQRRFQGAGREDRRHAGGGHRLRRQHRLQEELPAPGRVRLARQ